MASIKVPPTWDVSVTFVTSTGRRISAAVESFGEDFAEAMDNLSDADLEAAGLGREAHPDVGPGEKLIEVTLTARRR